MSDEYVLLIREPNWNPDAMTAEDWQAGMAGHGPFRRPSPRPVNASSPAVRCRP